MPSTHLTASTSSSALPSNNPSSRTPRLHSTTTHSDPPREPPDPCFRPPELKEPMVEKKEEPVLKKASEETTASWEESEKTETELEDGDIAESSAASVATSTESPAPEVTRRSASPVPDSVTSPDTAKSKPQKPKLSVRNPASMDLFFGFKSASSIESHTAGVPLPDSRIGRKTEDVKDLLTSMVEHAPMVESEKVECGDEVRLPPSMESPTVVVTGGPFKYRRDFLMSFMEVAKDRPQGLPTAQQIDVYVDHVSSPVGKCGTQRPWARLGRQGRGSHVEVRHGCSVPKSSEGRFQQHMADRVTGLMGGVMGPIGAPAGPHRVDSLPDVNHGGTMPKSSTRSERVDLTLPSRQPKILGTVRDPVSANPGGRMPRGRSGERGMPTILRQGFGMGFGDGDRRDGSRDRRSGRGGRRESPMPVLQPPLEPVEPLQKTKPLQKRKLLQKKESLQKSESGKKPTCLNKAAAMPVTSVEGLSEAAAELAPRIAPTGPKAIAEIYAEVQKEAAEEADRRASEEAERNQCKVAVSAGPTIPQRNASTHLRTVDMVKPKRGMKWGRSLGRKWAGRMDAEHGRNPPSLAPTDAAGASISTPHRHSQAAATPLPASEPQPGAASHEQSALNVNLVAKMPEVPVPVSQPQSCVASGPSTSCQMSAAVVAKSAGDCSAAAEGQGSKQSSLKLGKAASASSVKSQLGWCDRMERLKRILELKSLPLDQMLDVCCSFGKHDNAAQPSPRTTPGHMGKSPTVPPVGIKAEAGKQEGGSSEGAWTQPAKGGKGGAKEGRKKAAREVRQQEEDVHPAVLDVLRTEKEASATPRMLPMSMSPAQEEQDKKPVDVAGDDDLLAVEEQPEGKASKGKEPVEEELKGKQVKGKESNGKKPAEKKPAGELLLAKAEPIKVPANDQGSLVNDDLAKPEPGIVVDDDLLPVKPEPGIVVDDDLLPVKSEPSTVVDYDLLPEFDDQNAEDQVDLFGPMFGMEIEEVDLGKADFDFLCDLGGASGDLSGFAGAPTGGDVEGMVEMAYPQGEQQSQAEAGVGQDGFGYGAEGGQGYGYGEQAGHGEQAQAQDFREDASTWHGFGQQSQAQDVGVNTNARYGYCEQTQTEGYDASQYGQYADQGYGQFASSQQLQGEAFGYGEQVQETTENAVLPPVINQLMEYHFSTFSPATGVPPLSAALEGYDATKELDLFDDWIDFDAREEKEGVAVQGTKNLGEGEGGQGDFAVPQMQSAYGTPLAVGAMASAPNQGQKFIADEVAFKIGPSSAPAGPLRRFAHPRSLTAGRPTMRSSFHNARSLHGQMRDGVRAVPDGFGGRRRSPEPGRGDVVNGPLERDGVGAQIDFGAGQRGGETLQQEQQSETDVNFFLMHPNLEQLLGLGIGDGASVLAQRQHEAAERNGGQPGLFSSEGANVAAFSPTTFDAIDELLAVERRNSTTTASTEAPSTGLSFGASAAITVAPGGISFGGTAPTTSAPGGFSPGGTAATAGGLFLFGAPTTSAPAAGAFKFESTATSQRAAGGGVIGRRPAAATRGEAGFFGQSTVAPTSGFGGWMGFVAGGVRGQAGYQGGQNGYGQGAYWQQMMHGY
ncbi:hypothetical protein HK097_000859 [Rhizophlyctis rosea]|uniref:Uncharacterized protein n=1 Tax=Rhizophlyctis rosea TaxID=64517 RepID=A0AAD5S7I4_9FUNG|nr:hypothetical protein HK097_000859 [Rhizophlyctis rosea]